MPAADTHALRKFTRLGHEYPDYPGHLSPRVVTEMSFAAHRSRLEKTYFQTFGRDRNQERHSFV